MNVKDVRAKQPDISLNVRSVINDLVANGRLSSEDAEKISMKSRAKHQLNWHPLELIAEEAPVDQKNPGKILDLETLTLWLCEHSKQTYKRIDPLKIDSTVVTRLMSAEFAKRHGVLPLAVLDDEIVVASAEPYVSGWEATILQSQPGKVLTRVIANPADIRRYTTEFYQMAKSVSQANVQGLSALTNLEQML
ncbi:type II/IV secretion system protein, partial [Pseudomonadales bacterium]|nr:type II/IV secretion system protein [Pseudomonadales bacterium]